MILIVAIISMVVEGPAMIDKLDRSFNYFILKRELHDTSSKPCTQLHFRL